MTDRPILRLASGRVARRGAGQQDRRPRPRSRGAPAQGRRLGAQFDRLAAALAEEDPDVVLRRDPGGIAPERALVFVTAVPITNFVRAARLVGLEVLAELDLDEDYALDEELIVEHRNMVSPTLYATMPTRESFETLLRLWRAYQQGERPDDGYAPWQQLFEMLDDVRAWGPEDRLSAGARAELEERLAGDGAAEVRLELEVWPTRSGELRERWRREAGQRVAALGGRVVSRSSIEEEGFVYEALLVALSAGAVREMMADPSAPDGLATLHGLQFVLPQVVAQSQPNQSEPLDAPEIDGAAAFDGETPLRAVLLDGTPVAGHRSLDGGVVIEDVHDLVGRSVVAQRRHATSMASLILRGDLAADGAPVLDGRLLCIPVLVDAEGEASSPEDRLFVDVVHIALTRAFAGREPLAPEAFVVNFSVGLRRSHFAGRISSLARLLDWWAHSQGVLFVVSSGNVLEDLGIPGMTSVAFEDATLEERRELVLAAQRGSRHDRTLLAPSEALNALTVGAASVDLAPAGWAPRPGEVAIQDEQEAAPAISTAQGPGPFGAIKPDLLAYGGRHDVRTVAAGDNLRLRVIRESGRSGVFVAAARGGLSARERARGTSCAAALTTRCVLNAAAELTGENGPYAGQELSRRDLALLTRALAVNASRWPEAARARYRDECLRLGRYRHFQAKEEVSRQFGHGVLDADLMREAPGFGTTLVGVGTVRKDGAQVFEVPLPPSMSGDSVHRAMYVTLAWFSPVEASRARYRLAALEAVASDGGELGEDVEEKGWYLAMKNDHLDVKMIKRGTVWSRRMVHNRVRVPDFEEGASLPIRVQCRDASGGGLNPDEEIRFAIAVTLEVADTVRYDVYQEVRDGLLVRVQGAG